MRFHQRRVRAAFSCSRCRCLRRLPDRRESAGLVPERIISSPPGCAIRPLPSPPAALC